MSENTTSQNTSGKSSRLPVIIIGICVLGVLVFFFINSTIKRRNEAEAARVASLPKKAEVRVIKPMLSADTSVILLPGNIQGYRETQLYARVNGYVKTRLVDIGDAVKDGQTLAELETPELDQQLIQARANLELANSSLQRVNSVNLEGAVSAQQKADREGAYKSALALVNQLEAQKSFKRVVAPFSGIITSRNFDIGTLVDAGGTSVQPLFTISQINRLRIFVSIPQTFVPNIKVGSEANIIVQEIDAASVLGKVTRTAGALNPDTRTLLVQVEFENPDHKFLPGMYANVKFVAKRAHRAMVIPSNALVIKATGPQVVTVTADSVILAKPVTISKDYGSTVEVSGLDGSESLVTNASLDLTDGLKVMVQKPSHAKSKP